MESLIALFHYENYLDQISMSTEILSFVKDLVFKEF